MIVYMILNTPILYNGMIKWFEIVKVSLTG